MPRLPTPVMLATAIAAAAIAVLMAGLPAGGFFTGDAGVKLIAARNALTHPARPFDIDLPAIGGRPVARVDTMVVPHDGHAHVLQSPLFPVLSAPLIAVFGLRGAYLLPAVSFVLMVPLFETMRRVLTPATPPSVVAALALVANPLFFYSLEFWEHAPAVALLAACTTVIVQLKAHAATKGEADRARPRGADLDAHAIVAGALGGLAVLFRPEAALYVAALVVAFRPPIRRAIAVAAGAALVIAPLSVASYVHSGSLVGTHLSNTLAPISGHWLDERAARVVAWLWPRTTWEGLALLTIALGWIARAIGAPIKACQTIGLAGAAWVSVLAAEQAVDRNSLWQAFPVAALALVPSGSTVALRRLQLSAALGAALIVLTATHDGGAQWGPRFLLIITPPVMLLAASTIADAIDAGSWRPARVALIAVTVVAALLTTRAAYRELRGAKLLYARIVHATASLTEADEPIVTNVWWFDQVDAPLYGTRTFLYASDPIVATETLGELATAGQHHLTLVWTKEPEGRPLDSVTEGTCYRIRNVKSIPERQLVFASAVCQP